MALGQIGAGIAAAQLEDAVDVLINGDGSKDGITFASSTSLSYADFLKLWGSLAPYQLNASPQAPAASRSSCRSASLKTPGS